MRQDKGAQGESSTKTDANMLLRDGQSAQCVPATDSVSGEVLKLEVTLNMVK